MFPREVYHRLRPLHLSLLEQKHRKQRDQTSSLGLEGGCWAEVLKTFERYELNGLDIGVTRQEDTRP